MWLLARKLQWIFWLKTCCSRLFCVFHIGHMTQAVRRMYKITRKLKMFDSFLGCLGVYFEDHIKSRE